MRSISKVRIGKRLPSIRRPMIVTIANANTKTQTTVTQTAVSQVYKDVLNIRNQTLTSIRE